MRRPAPIATGQADLAALHRDMARNAVALGELARPCALWVPSVRDLVASSERLWPGQRVAALGYAVPGDGGGGVFRFSVDPPPGDAGIVLPRLSGLGGWVREMRTAAVSAEMFGAGGEGTGGEGAGDDDALQALFDSAARENVSAVLTAGQSYRVTRALFIRASGTRLMGNGARLVLAAEEIKGSVLTICNASDIHVEQLGIDVAGRMQNGLTLIGNTSEFPETIALGPQAPVRAVTLRDIEVAGARFHINRREAAVMASPLPDARVGDRVTGLDSMWRAVEGDIAGVDNDGLLLTVDWRINRVHPGTMLMLSRTGAKALVRDRQSVPMVEPLSGMRFASWGGKFGGKGLSIQRACAQIDVRGVRIDDCDIGLTLEAHPPAPANGLTATSVTDVEISRCSRTAIWCHSSAGQTTDAMQAAISNVRISDPCLAGDRMGVLSMDRAANLTLSDIAIAFTVPPPDLRHYAVIRGLFTRCAFDRITLDGPAECGVAYEPHARWGNAPGDFTANTGEDSADMTLLRPAEIGPLLKWRQGFLKPVNSTFRFTSHGALTPAQLALPTDNDGSIILSTQVVEAGA
jgi:hypothetical protein